ncbi:MAG: hypothetical protein ACHP7E_05785 [Burkholderiales bacterium]
MNEDTLVQQTTADYLRDALGWRSEYAYNTEVLGPEGTFGRKSEKDVVLTRILGEKLVALNPGLPDVAYREALRQVWKWARAWAPWRPPLERFSLAPTSSW